MHLFLLVRNLSSPTNDLLNGGWRDDTASFKALVIIGLFHIHNLTEKPTNDWRSSDHRGYEKRYPSHPDSWEISYSLELQAIIRIQTCFSDNRVKSFLLSSLLIIKQYHVIDKRQPLERRPRLHLSLKEATLH